MPLSLQQMVWDLQRRVDQLEEELTRAATVRERLQPEAQPPTPEPPRIAKPAASLHGRVLQAVASVFHVHEDELRAPKGAAPTMPARRAVATILCNNGVSTVQAGVILGMHQSNICKLRREALATYQKDAAFRAQFDTAAALAKEPAQ